MSAAEQLRNTALPTTFICYGSTSGAHEGCVGHAEYTEMSLHHLPNPSSAAMPEAKKEGDDDEVQVCRVCLEDGTEEPLLSPCLCDGGSRYVHRSCLQSYFNSPLGLIRLSRHPNSVHECEICGTTYPVSNGGGVLLSIARTTLLYGASLVATVMVSSAIGTGFILFLRWLPFESSENMCASWVSANYAIGYGVLAVKDGHEWRGEPIGGTSIDFMSNLSHLPLKIIMFDCQQDAAMQAPPRLRPRTTYKTSVSLPLAMCIVQV